MPKKVMLITGASRGIGKAIHEKYTNQYECITVHRTAGATFQGDLTDRDFRERVIQQVNPDVVINNAGSYGTVLNGIQVNGVAAAHLMLEFHKKMSRGHIILISSLRSTFQGYEKIGVNFYQDIDYNCGKAMATSCAIQLSNIKTKPVSVVCIEPGVVKTAMSLVDDPIYCDPDLWTNEIHTPLVPQDIVTTIDWVLNQPPWVNPSLIRLSNNSRVKFNPRQP